MRGMADRVGERHRSSIRVSLVALLVAVPLSAQQQALVIEQVSLIDGNGRNHRPGESSDTGERQRYGVASIQEVSSSPESALIERVESGETKYFLPAKGEKP